METNIPQSPGPPPSLQEIFLLLLTALRENSLSPEEGLLRLRHLNLVGDPLAILLQNLYVAQNE